MTTIDLAHVDVWLFDLDNTLYPPEAEFMSLIEGRMTQFVARETGLSRAEAYALQKRYLSEHGTTLAGLMANHGVNPEAFLDEVHDVSMAGLVPDPELRQAIAALPGRRLVFTNGDKNHAERVLARLQLDDLFEATFHIALADYIPKPHPQTFRRMIEAHDVDPRRTAFFEDSARNLAPAFDLGMTTVLVGPHAFEGDAPYVHHRTDNLTAFLRSAVVQETPV
ncbi:MAG: pyrimidine 5-nucleotidase family protein [Caulobacteraceae bacterium]|nr:pyrimidine 5-nucleotidase family protein [Caulobacteraceae bacterium]